jgi:cytochrome P450
MARNRVLLMNFAVSILRHVAAKISPEIRSIVEQIVRDLWNKAVVTSNKWDDILVRVLADIFGVTIPGKK